MKIKNIIQNEEKRTITSITISIIGLILSFIGIKIGPIDPAWISIILCGLPIFKDAATGLITNFDIKADVLVTIAIIASIIIGEIFAAGEISTIMMIGGFLEEFTVQKTEKGIEKLIKLKPTKGTKIINYKKTNQKEQTINAEEIKENDILKIRPGETIPVDGKIIEGETSIDQSILTGESLPIDKTKNDEIYSGTVNLYGSFYMKATHNGENSSLQKLIKLVESASPENVKIVRQADKWATWIVIIAVISAIGTYILTKEIIRSVTILVVFCPCALVLATPTAIMAAIGNLTKYGILIRDGISIEKLAKVKKIVFDKTGTLTTGNLQVIETIPYKYNKDKLIKIITSVENKSEHPIAKAITKKYNTSETQEISKFKMEIGKGIKAQTKIENQTKTIHIGNEKLLKENNINIPEDFKNKTQKYENKGATIIYTTINNQLIGATILSDTLRKDSKTLIKTLQQNQIQPVLLTGDNKDATDYISSQLKIKHKKSNCLPEDKINFITECQKNNEIIAMVGDGINDAPSLKKADIGISMGKIGSDISIDASDVTLINDEIKYIPHLLELSKKTLKTINIGISFSLILNFIAMILAILGIMGPVAGALVHNIGSVFVIIYSSLLVKFKT